ncbi:MAG TPA: hypothetical protein VE861_14760 [Gemmatimonadaceae bacterium]|nr:hypothetical protein [Gemmatimonadaceae bacterium]
MTIDPMQRLERTIKIIVAMISLVGLTFIGLRVMASRSSLHLPDPKRECEAVGRTYDSARATCLPR